MTKEEIVQKALVIGREAERSFAGCSQSTFYAIVETLREAGIELMTKEEEDMVFKGMIALEGGFAGTSKGTCGGATGAGFCVSLAAGQGIKEELENKFGAILKASTPVVEGILPKFMEEYGSIKCEDIQLKKFGKVVDFNWEGGKLMGEFLSNSKTHPACQNGNCTIAQATAWAVEKICDMKGVK